MSPQPWRHVIQRRGSLVLNKSCSSLIVTVLLFTVASAAEPLWVPVV